WYKHNALIGGNHRIIDIGTGPNNQGILLMFPDSNRLFVRTPNQSDSPINIPAGVRIRNWNHYAISVSNTGVCSFYMNGRLIFSRAGGGRTPQTIFSLNYLGKSNYGAPDAPSEGQFTDFRIWDNAIDSTVYNTRGVPYFSTNTGANLIFYLPLSEPVYNSNITLPENYRLINKSIVTSTALLDSVSYIKGSSNSYNFDSNRIFVAGQSPLANAAKTVTVITNNYASVADTTIKNATSTMSNNIKNYYWSVDLPSSQGAYLNNQILSISDYVSAISNFSYKYLIKYLPNYTTYLPGDSVQVFTSKAGFKLPRNDFWVANQKPTKYKWIDSGGLNNVINMQLDTVTGRFSWLALTEPVESVYPIKVSVTNEVGTIIFNGQVLLSDSLQSIQYPIDSLSVNFGKDSSSVPYTEGITASTRFNITAVPNNGAITINTLNGRLYWTTNVPPGLYTLKIQASNYINTVSKTIKLNIKTVSPTGLTYQTKNYAFINTGFDTSTTYINAPVVNTGGSAVKYMANTPTGCRIDSNTGAINCKKNLVTAGNYRVIVNAQNVAGFVKDTLYINVSTTSKDSIIGYKNAYYTLNTDATNIGGDYIGLPNTDLPNNFSIEAWVKLTDITRNYQQIFDAGNAANNHVISIGTFSNTGRLFITIPTAASGNASVDIPDTATVPRIANNTWFHVAYIKRGTNVSLYLNGTKVIDNNTAAVSYNTTITQVYFGASNFANQSMLGQLDECRIWRRALSEFEINRYKNVFLSPQDDSLYVYLPLHGFLIKDTNIAEGTVIKNRATGALALTDPITVYGNGMKMSRDSNRQIVYGTHDSLTTTTKIITVKVNYFRQPPANFVNTTAVKQGNYWTTLNNNIPTNLLLGTLTVSKSASEIFKPNPFNVYYPPTKLTYNNLNTYKLGQTTTLYTTNKPTIATNYDSANMTITMSPVYAGISINGTTGIITINTDTVYKLYGKQVKTRVTAETGLGKTSTELTFNIVNTNIIGYNNTSVCLPNNNGADYIHLPNIDLSNVNFAVETWFKLIGSPINNKRIFDFAPGTSGSARSGLLMWFAGNKLYLGAFNQDQLINFG
ncbi:MAG: hypothetical protein ORN58_02050, partial [Sediminibacterium sp.]|nr:hypothetical protein [Sediminibacterium sp.]